MATKPGLGLVQRQGLALTEGMRQSLALLRMPTQAAAEAIAREADENPFLLVEMSSTGGGSAYDYALSVTAVQEGFTEKLHRQIALQRLDPATAAAAIYLVSELREDGYLDVTLEELVAETGVPLAVLEQGLRALQACEPPGVGARDLAECLALKLVDAGIDRALAFAATRRLDDFAEGRWPRLARELGQPRSVLERIAALLRSFGSAPVNEDSTWIEAMIPEIVVEVGPQGGITVSPLPGALPTVSVMPVARGALDGEKLRAYHDRARRMAAAVSARRATLLRIGRHIAELQAAFFVGGQESIQPVTRTEAAASLAMHPSTLGRAIAGKALLAGTRVYPLSLFFARALGGPDGGLSPFDVQRRIREIIDHESGDVPLADDGIRAQLKKEGVDIARRTVAKYRKCMRIPSSFGRTRRRAT
ncbi:MAG: RNA polymerase sigma-54 factor [Albidovulum sp.]